jgi:hypothetical protein
LPAEEPIAWNVGTPMPQPTRLDISGVFIASISQKPPFRKRHIQPMQPERFKA